MDHDKAADALENLASFKSNVTLKQATYAFISSQLLTTAERDNLSKIFNAFDSNGDGTLSMQEIKDGYAQHYGKILSEEEVKEMFESVDTDGSGTIEFSEFVVAAMQQRQLTSSDKLQAAFRMFDKDGSGIISADEIRDVLNFGGSNTLSVEAVDKIIQQVDVNGDGEISFEEFVTMMTSLE